MAKLIVSYEGTLLDEIDLTDERTTIGRKPHNDIQIEDVVVSGEHAVITTEDDETFIEDLKSTNGTYVNGKAIKKHALEDGDVIEIGKHVLEYALTDDDEDYDDDDEDEDYDEDDEDETEEEVEVVNKAVVKAPAKLTPAPGAAQTPQKTAGRTSSMSAHTQPEPSAKPQNPAAQANKPVAAKPAEGQAKPAMPARAPAAAKPQIDAKAQSTLKPAKPASPPAPDKKATGLKPAPAVPKEAPVKSDAAMKETAPKKEAPAKAAPPPKKTDQSTKSLEKKTPDNKAIVKAVTQAHEPQATPAPNQKENEAVFNLQKAVVQLLTGPNVGKETELNKPSTPLGKPGTPGTTIARRADGYFLSNTGKTKALLNHEELGSQGELLKNHDLIEVGGVKMEFYYKG